jgi:hypothetical protein
MVLAGQLKRPFFLNPAAPRPEPSLNVYVQTANSNMPSKSLDRENTRINTSPVVCPPLSAEALMKECVELSSQIVRLKAELQAAISEKDMQSSFNASLISRLTTQTAELQAAIAEQCSLNNSLSCQIQTQAAELRAAIAEKDKHYLLTIALSTQLSQQAAEFQLKDQTLQQKLRDYEDRESLMQNKDAHITLQALADETSRQRIEKKSPVRSNELANCSKVEPSGWTPVLEPASSPILELPSLADIAAAVLAASSDSDSVRVGIETQSAEQTRDRLVSNVSDNGMDIEWQIRYDKLLMDNNELSQNYGCLLEKYCQLEAQPRPLHRPSSPLSQKPQLRLSVLLGSPKCTSSAADSPSLHETLRHHEENFGDERARLQLEINTLKQDRDADAETVVSMLAPLMIEVDALREDKERLMASNARLVDNIDGVLGEALHTSQALTELLDGERVER